MIFQQSLFGDNKLLSSATLVKMMNNSCYPNISCLFTTTIHLKMSWMPGGGGGQPTPAGLAYPQRFLSTDSLLDVVIAVNCCYMYKREFFTKSY